MKNGSFMTRLFFVIIVAAVFFPGAVCAEQDKATTDTQKIIVSYFHGDIRCHACLNIERYAEEFVKATYAREITSGTIEWRAFNFDKRGNEHYLTDYNLPSPAVILSEIRNGKETRWKNLDKIWEREADKDSFVQYIKEEIQEFMKPDKTGGLPHEPAHPSK